MTDEIKNLVETMVPENKSDFITEEQARSLLNDIFTNFTGIMRVQSGYAQSGGYIENQSGWKIDSNGNAYFANIAIYGGTIRYGKTTFTDSTNAGYILSPFGFYMGAAADAAYLKYVISSGALSLIGGSFQTSDLGGSSGRGVKIEGGTNKDIKFYSNADYKSYIGGYTDSDGDGESEYIRIGALSGRYISLRDSNGVINGNFVPKTDNYYSNGTSGKRWSVGYFEDIVVDDLTVNTGCSGCGYKELNLLSDAQKSEVFSKPAGFTKEEISDFAKDKKIKNGDAELELINLKKQELKKRNFTGFKKGDVLTWGEKGLEKCSKDTCRCVVGVADKRGIPIVLGAETVNVIGKVLRGQFLVSSTESGFARAWDRNTEGQEQIGTVIAMAMENKDNSGKGKIKAMIQKF